MVPRPPSRFKISYGVRPENGSNGLPDIINCYIGRTVKGRYAGWRRAAPYPTSLLRHYCTETNKRRKLFHAAYRITCWNKRLIEFRSAQPKALPLPIALQTLCHLLYRLHASSLRFPVPSTHVNAIINLTVLASTRIPCNH